MARGPMVKAKRRRTRPLAEEWTWGSIVKSSRSSPGPWTQKWEMAGGSARQKVILTVRPVLVRASAVVAFSRMAK